MKTLTGNWEKFGRMTNDRCLNDDDRGLDHFATSTVFPRKVKHRWVRLGEGQKVLAQASTHPPVETSRPK